MSNHFIGKVTPPNEITEPAIWLVFCENQILLFQSDDTISIPEHINLANLGLSLLTQHYLGEWQNQHCFCAEIELTTNLPDNFILQPLRQAALQLGNDWFELASRAIQTLQWDKDHQFCSRCATSLQFSLTERAKICPNCQFSHYPRISPSIIVLIKRGKEVLLARSPHFSPGVYSTLAGFIEPGETAEQAVEREVYEEVGVKIKNLQYHFSQSWPFPHSLMLGFTAEHAAGEIHIDGVEIEDAGWFTLENLPVLPLSISISKRLIDLFINKEI